MRVRPLCARVFILGLILASAPASQAGPLSPCMKAGNSANGSYLVIRYQRLEPGTKIVSGQPYKVREIKLQVYPKEKFINEDRLVSDSTFWTDATLLGWSVILDLHALRFMSPCPYFLITNDGEFLVIFGGGVEPGALRIYRRHDQFGDPVRIGPDHGVFIREVPLKELWPAERFEYWRTQTFTDETPQWFAGQNFEFSRDSRQLIYKTRWGTTVRIHLENGSVGN